MKYGNVLNNMHFLAMVICMRNKTKNSIDATFPINVGEMHELDRYQSDKFNKEFWKFSVLSRLHLLSFLLWTPQRWQIYRIWNFALCLFSLLCYLVMFIYYIIMLILFIWTINYQYILSTLHKIQWTGPVCVGRYSPKMIDRNLFTFSLS